MIVLLVAAAAVVLVLAFVSDARYLLRWSAHRDALRREGRWDELITYVHAHARSLRPLLVVQRWWLRPGLAEAQLALDLVHAGDWEGALDRAHTATRRARHGRKEEPAIVGALAAVLLQTQRGDEALELEPRLRALGTPGIRFLASVALVRVQRGELDVAIALLQEVLTNFPREDGAWHAMAMALAWKGEFDAANAVLEQPLHGPQLDPEFVGRLRGLSVPEAAEFLKRIGRRHAGIHGPTRLLAMAEVHLMSGDIAHASALVEQARGGARVSPILDVVHARLAAHVAAARGDAATAELELKRMDALVAAHRGWSRRHEAGTIRGICHVLLGRPGASSVLIAARERAPGALARMWIGYWLVKAYALDGDRDAADRERQIVATCAIETWFVRELAMTAPVASA